MASSSQNVDPSYYRQLARLPKPFTYQELVQATNNFSEMLGEGAFGSVFKGCLKDGTPIAVKRVKWSEYGKIQFEAEISAIARVQHKHLVYLQGFCSHEIEVGRELYIVYDLLRNGSLNLWILSRDGVPSDQILSWKLRYQVAIDVAKALVYLHDFCSPPIIHFDVKPANVLLDDNFRGVLTDFGLSVVTGSHAHSFFVRGTRGYIAPEMVKNNEKSSKSDMYSFGKVLLDMFFGQVYVCLDTRGNDIYKEDGNSFAEEQIFHTFMREKLEKNEIVHLADKKLEEVNEAEANTLVDVALRCVEEDPKLRPRDMQNVLQLLERRQQDQHENPGTIGDSQQALKENPFPVAYYAPPEPVPVKRSETFASQQSVKHQIFTALKDNQVNMVGVYGMGGVGKTTLMSQILQDAKNSSQFENVLMVTISQNRLLEDIQTEIAEKLGIEFHVTSVSVRAMRLYARLKQVKSLIILDDMWKQLSLSEVGIPHGEDNHSCKVVMTTKSSDLCTQMDVQASIEVKVLPENESWELFRHNAGKDVDSDEFQSLAKTIVRECKGLPLAIVILANALKGKIRDRWVVALQQLKRSMFKDISTALSPIRTSYEFLDSNETKFCFLLCCLFPEDHKINMDEMLMYAVGEDILEDTETLSEARGRLSQIVDLLISSSLLLKCDGSEFMMHDIVRDAAISIASESGNDFTVKAGRGLRKWPKLKERGNILRLSLMDNNISALPDQLGCERLVTLSLAGNSNLQRLPDEFGTAMTALTTLDLSHTGISSLPQSFSSLTNLRTLNLGYCTLLVDVSLCGCLKDLEILILSSCRIKSIPKEFKFLTNLKLLDLNHNWCIKTITPNVISSLSSLEELYIDRFFNWETEGLEERKNACLSELSSLTSLSALHLRTKDDSLLYKDPLFRWKNLKKFRIEVTEKIIGVDIYSNSLSISSIDDIKDIAAWVRGLWVKTDELRLDYCSKITNVIPLLHSRFNNLKFLKLQDCVKIEYLIQTEEIGDEAVFTELEILELTDLSDIKGICSSGLMPKGSFNKLKRLCMHRCHNLVNVIPGGLLVKLYNLEFVDVHHCHEVEVLFNSEDLPEERHVSLLSKLKKIILEDLPEFRTIWKGFSAIPQNLKHIVLSGCHKLRYAFPFSMSNNLHQLEILRIMYCDELMQIFGLKEEDEIHEICNCSQPLEITVVFPRLKTLELKGLQNLLRFHSYGSVIVSFPSLEKVTIKSCPNLRRVPLGLESTPKLETLEVLDCRLIVELFEEYREGVDINTVFPRLKTLRLQNLQTISRFSSQSSVIFSFPSLHYVSIYSCPNLTSVPLGLDCAPKLMDIFSDKKW